MDGDKPQNIGRTIRKLIDSNYVEDFFDGPYILKRDPRFTKRCGRGLAIGPVEGTIVIVYFRRTKGRSCPLDVFEANRDESEEYWKRIKQGGVGQR